jgi:hypothetical protein
MTFTKWLDTLIEEKNIDTEFVTFEIEGESGMNFIPLGCVIEAIKNTSKVEQNAIKHNLVMIDFKNGNIVHYFEHLAKALAI